jgi:hypothetical protein
MAKRTPVKAPVQPKKKLPKPASAKAMPRAAAGQPPQTTAGSGQKARRLKVARYRSFHLQKRLKRQTTQVIPGAPKLFKDSLRLLARNWKVFVGIALIYGIFNIVLVTGFSLVDLKGAKESLGDALNGQAKGQVSTAISLFVYLLGSSNEAPSATASVYRIVIGIIISLAIIWALRQTHAGNKVRLRDAFYQGMYPLVPFMAVLAVIGLQLVPVVGGVLLYGTAMNNDIAITFAEQVAWTALLLLLVLLSLYMLASSVFAMYIVSLPDMGPMGALRSARQLVLHRRWTLLRRLLFLPLAILVCIVVAIVPLLFFAVAAAPWAFLVLSTFLLPVVYSYLYTVYRALL